MNGVEKTKVATLTQEDDQSQDGDNTDTDNKRPKKKIAAIILGVILLLIALVLVVGSVVTGVSPAEIPAYWADQTGITQNNTEAAMDSEQLYTTFESVPDCTWVAGTTTQPIRLVNAAGNPVDLAPHVYVDVNGDGEFAEDECVWNPVEYDDEGNVTSWGALIAPGNQVSQIEIDREIPEGTYAAHVTFTALLLETHDLTNPMSFDFTVTVAQE